MKNKKPFGREIGTGSGKQTEIETKILASAAKALNQQELDSCVERICQRAWKLTADKWKPGTTLSFEFEKAGENFAISLDWLLDGKYFCLIGTPEEIDSCFQPNPSPEARPVNEGQHKWKWN